MVIQFTLGLNNLFVFADKDFVLEVLLPIDEEEDTLLTSESVLAVDGSLLPSETGAKKLLREDCPDELEDLDVLEDLGATCYLEEAALH